MVVNVPVGLAGANDSDGHTEIRKTKDESKNRRNKQAIPTSGDQRKAEITTMGKDIVHQTTSWSEILRTKVKHIDKSNGEGEHAQRGTTSERRDKKQQ